MKTLSILLFLVSGSVLACIPCNEPHAPAELILFSEPFWNKNDVPEATKGTVVASFDLSESGRPYNIQILKVSPNNLEKSKLVKSISNSKFKIETDKCGKLKRELNVNLTHTFELHFDNVLSL